MTRELSDIIERIAVLSQRAQDDREELRNLGPELDARLAPIVLELLKDVRWVLECDHGTYRFYAQSNPFKILEQLSFRKTQGYPLKLANKIFIEERMGRIAIDIPNDVNVCAEFVGAWNMCTDRIGNSVYELNRWHEEQIKEVSKWEEAFGSGE